MKWETYGRLNLDRYYHFGLRRETAIHYDLAEDWQELSFLSNGWHRLDSETDTEMLVDLFEEAMWTESPREDKIPNPQYPGGSNPILFLAS